MLSCDKYEHQIKCYENLETTESVSSSNNVAPKSRPDRTAEGHTSTFNDDVRIESSSTQTRLQTKSAEAFVPVKSNTESSEKVAATSPPIRRKSSESPMHQAGVQCQTEFPSTMHENGKQTLSNDDSTKISANEEPNGTLNSTDFFRTLGVSQAQSESRPSKRLKHGDDEAPSSVTASETSIAETLTTPQQKQAPESLSAFTEALETPRSVSMSTTVTTIKTPPPNSLSGANNLRSETNPQIVLQRPSATSSSQTAPHKRLPRKRKGIGVDDVVVVDDTRYINSVPNKLRRVAGNNGNPLWNMICDFPRELYTDFNKFHTTMCRWEWYEIDGVKVPAISRPGRGKFVATIIVQVKLTGKFITNIAKTAVVEPMIPYKMTIEEAWMMNFVNTVVSNFDLGLHIFTNNDDIVDVNALENYYYQIKKHHLSYFMSIYTADLPSSTILENKNLVGAIFNLKKNIGAEIAKMSQPKLPDFVSNDYFHS